ncbi:DUF2279 domain-containing protein [Flaviaesturariibacter amylovorans]|uniref:DUF2279 domain-containing protein n=2 Tax=Flaviaesturariibacter amylovorans TaxID=1084520 RepID=A0ABP8GSK7_9BACT
MLLLGRAYAQDSTSLTRIDSLLRDTTPFTGRVPSLCIGCGRASAAEMLAAKPTTNAHLGRKLFVDGLGVGIYGGMLVWLNGAWYKNYQRSSFHTFNDAGEWQQMDKAGHAWAVYSMSHIGFGLWCWSGYSNKAATLLSAGSGLAFMLGVEYLDGRSAEWGWSWADVGANAFGAGLFAAQQLTWREQKIRLKFSSHMASYPSDLRARARELFGSSAQNKLLKDYNAQTYWLSFPLPERWKLPKWLRLSVGYGAQGMFGGYANEAKEPDGTVTFSRPDIKRYRQWYLAPDIDLTQIRTRSKFLRSVFYSINILKFPAPSIEYSNGSFKVHALHF